ncbi:hypothetical protein BGZ97_002418 [Linnemannia gamsii]|uniref:Uncharacterized protein n=1 Tax=Linnemannia gamsii TaxID=64522 RepID=A0A9P6RKK0_9FUNG|nr:hypothetical protein BGZ97_002418 [Linnemannia gamsii]
MNYSSRIRRALVKTLSGHAIPLPRSIKRVTFNDTLQFHTTTTNRRRARFGDEDDEEEEDEEDEDEDEADSTSSSPVLRFFSAGFSGTSELAISPKAPMSTSPSTSTPSPVPGRGSWKKEKKNRPPSIMPSARDRLQLQDQDDLEDLAAATLQQEDVRSGGVFNVVSNGRSIPVSTTTMTPGASTMGKKLASTITIALPPLSRPRKQQPLAPQQQQQQQAQMPVSPMFSITATSTSSAAATTTSTATTTTTTTTTSMTMTVPTSYTPSSGTSGLASALLSSLMMPAAPGPISDAARSLLTSTSTSTPTSAPPTVDTFAPALSDSDSSKGSTGRGGHLKRTRSAPSKISTFLQQHRLTRQQQQQSGQMQGQGLFSPGEYTSSPRDLVSSPKHWCTAAFGSDIPHYQHVPLPLPAARWSRCYSGDDDDGDGLFSYAPEAQEC